MYVDVGKCRWLVNPDSEYREHGNDLHPARCLKPCVYDLPEWESGRRNVLRSRHADPEHRCAPWPSRDELSTWSHDGYGDRSERSECSVDDVIDDDADMECRLSADSVVVGHHPWIRGQDLT